MKNLGYYNGDIGLIEDMKIPMTDRAFYFGDGVYDAVMCRNNIPYLLSEHIERFYKNCNKVSIGIPMAENELYELICELVRKVEATEKFVYFHASRGSGYRAHELSFDNGNICVMIMPREMESIDKKMTAILIPDIRYELCDIKTLNLLPNVLASQTASKEGADEAILHRNGIVTEGTHCNVSILSNEKIITAPADRHILPGVTRAHLLQTAREEGIEVEERKYTVAELFEADEILVSSSSKMLRAVEKIDGRMVGGRNPRLFNLLKNRLFSDYYKATDASI